MLNEGRANEVVEMALTNFEWMLLREKKKKKENKSPDLIQQGLDEVILSKVSNAEYSKKAWAWGTLESCYHSVAKVKNVKS